MRIFKAILLFLGIYFSNVDLIAQEVPKKILVEHFTNTRCSVCAVRNPGFYTALNQKPNVLHVAYHPSSPYSNCLFSTQNKAENDERTRFYQIYGSTPRFIINGEERSSNAVQNTSVYSTFENETTPISVNIGLLPSGMDSIKVNVVVSAIASHNLTNLTLYVPLVEETVNYSAPNGEGTHHDVFRKSFTGINPIPFAAPAHNGTPYTYKATIVKNNLWNLDKLYALAIVHTSNKTIVQTEASALFDKNVVLSTDQEITSHPLFVISPNPANDMLFINSDKATTISHLNIYDISGKIIIKLTDVNINNGIDISTLTKGTYLARIYQDDGKHVVSKFVKQ